MLTRAALCLSLIACGSTPSNTAKPKTSSADTVDEMSAWERSATCAQRIATLRNNPDAEPQTSVELPTAERWHPFVKPGVMVQVTRRNLVIAGQEVSWVQPERIQTLLAEAGKRAAKTHDELTTPLYVIAEAAVPAARLHDVVKSAPRSLLPRLVVRRAKPTPAVAAVRAPPDAGTWFAAWLSKAQKLTAEQAGADELRKGEIKTELTVMYRRGIKRAIGENCPQLIKVYQDAAKAAPAERGALLAKGIPDALDACKCAGVDRAYDVIVHVMSSQPRTMGWLALPRTISDPGSVRNVATILSAKLRK